MGPEQAWITTRKGHSYFSTSEGKDWTPVGQNDAITWPELRGLFMDRDVQSAQSYFENLRVHGITCMRLMLEYCHTEHRYLEKPVGYFQPHMIELWDRIFNYAGTYGIRLLVTPFDTFWMRRRWRHHPYNRLQGGPCRTKTEWLRSPAMRAAIKNRLDFVTTRWGNSGTLFAWDLWNEIHPSHAGNEVELLSDFVYDVGGHLRATEERLYGRSHLQTVSFYGTSLLRDHRIATIAFRHPALDFATIHLYDHRAIDRPVNTVDAAFVCRELVRQVLSEINDDRPFFDSEHGPIYTFNNRRKTLDAPFDEEYFSNMQWAHLASGGTGGGLRWPYRHPHVLTPAMRISQKSLARFCELVDWRRFVRVNFDSSFHIDRPGVTAIACGTTEQCIAWFVRDEKSGARGRIRISKQPDSFSLTIRQGEGRYKAVFWETKSGTAVTELELNFDGEVTSIQLPPFQTDIALYLRKI